MKKMTVKKLMSLLAVCLSAVCLLSGCGGQGEQSGNTDGKENGSEICTVLFWFRSRRRITSAATIRERSVGMAAPATPI